MALRLGSGFLVGALFLLNWAFAQYSIQFRGLSSWRGGGFGMFAAFGQVPERRVRLLASGKPIVVSRDCSSQLRQSMELPTRARVGALAKCVNQPVVKVQIWDQSYFGARNVGYRLVAEHDFN